MGKLGAYEKQAARPLTNDEKGELIKKYAVLVRVMAYRVAGRMPPMQEFEDMISSGTVGLLEAIESFDPAIGVKFETYAKFRIRGAILDDVRYKDWVPRSVREKLRELDQITRKLSTDLKRKPEDEDLAKALGFTLEQYYDYLVTIQPAGMLSYEDLGLSRATEKSVIDFLEDKSSPHPDVEIHIKEIKNRIIEALESLESDEQLAMSLYYYEGLTFKEIAVIMDVSESRASQVHAKALSKLNFRLKDFRENLQTLAEYSANQGPMTPDDS